jgi:hypothetical protein
MSWDVPFWQPFGQGVTVQSISWTDCPDPIPTPVLDENSDIPGDHVAVDYHFTAVVEKADGSIENVPFIKSIEIE